MNKQVHWLKSKWNRWPRDASGGGSQQHSYLESEVEPPELAELLGDAAELPFVEAALPLVPGP
jgi:hypothetical protein